MEMNNVNMKLPYYHKYNNTMHVLHGDSSTLIFVRNYESKVMKILAQAMVLALLIMIFPELVQSTFRATHHTSLLTYKSMKINSNSLPLIITDLINEGLLTNKDKSLILSEDKKITLGEDFTKVIISPFDLKRQRLIKDETFDFVFSDCYSMGNEFIDRSLKLGGIMTVQLSRDPNLAFQVPSNYKIVYFRKIDDSTFTAMRKISTTASSSIRRKLLEFLSEEKKAILRNLEDVLLEPPRSATGKSKAYLRKTKFLPDLLNDSLEGYSRRVYIDVGGGHGSTRWFEQNYPTRNKDFDMYRIETVPETEVDQSEDAWEGPPTQMGISDWLWRNVKAEEYVVMKAEAEVVEEMLKSKAIVLVDELFLECKPFGKGGRSNRAYWECLALYGRLRDFGVAVHQWWG